MTEADGWSFTLDEDGMVFVVTPPGVPENVRLAVETVLIPFGDDYFLAATSAQVRRVGPDEIELGDVYGQFKDCRMSVHGFERMLGRLIDFLKPLQGPER